MAEYAFEFDFRQTLHAVGKRFQIGERNSQPRHASINFQMDGNFAFEPQTAGGLRQGCSIFEAKHGRRKRVMQGVFFLAGIKSAQHQDASGDPCLAQKHAFVGGGDAEPLGAGLLQRGRTLFHAVSVSVALHHCADGDLCADVSLQHSKIVAQSGERNFSPVGPGLDAGGCKTRSQVLMIMQDRVRVEATSRYFLSSCRRLYPRRCTFPIVLLILFSGDSSY